MVPWECSFASHGHAVVFQLLDSGENPMAMKNSDTVMPTCRNPVGSIWLILLRLALMNHRGA